MQEEIFTCVRCGKTGDVLTDDSYQPIMVHESCLADGQRIHIDDHSRELGSDDPDHDLCLICLSTGAPRVLATVHDYCLTEKEWSRIFADQDAFIEAHEKAFPGDTYETSPDGEFQIRHAHAAELYEMDPRSGRPGLDESPLGAG